MSRYDSDDLDPRDAEDDDMESTRLSIVRYAQNRVRVPAIIMLVFSIISLIFVPLGAINFFTLPEAFNQQREIIDQNPNMPAGDKQRVKEVLDLYEKVILLVLPFTLTLQLIVGIVSVVGSLKMLNLRSRGWAMTTSILSIVSIGHGCCFLTLPIGIWALVVLMDERVKGGFAMAQRSRQTQGDDRYYN